MSILLTAIIAGLVGYFIGCLIGENEVRKQLQSDEAFYGEIVNKQPNELTIREIDEEGDFMQYRKLVSEDGVSDDLYEGDIIFAYE